MTFVWGVLTGLVIGLVLAFTPLGAGLFQLRLLLDWLRGKE